MFFVGLMVGVAVSVAIAAPVVVFSLKRQIRRARAAEGRLRTAQRLAEIGSMTGGLAHEIRNPLSTIGLNAQLLAEGLEELSIDASEKGRLIRRLESLRREADRLRDTLADFLRFAGQVRLDQKRVDLNSVVEEIVDFYQPQAEHRGVSMRSSLWKDPLPVMLDASMFKQALLNLLINATQAMEGLDVGGGREKELMLRTVVRRGPEGVSCEVHVIDTGPGIAGEMLERIFTPYFTTKAGGTGLGLPTAKRLVEEHGGTIRVHSEPGMGTEFVISLPRAG